MPRCSPPTLLNAIGEAQWQGCRAKLVALAAAGSDPGGAPARNRRFEAQDALLEVDDLLTYQRVDAERIVWLQVGRALRALRLGDLWPVLYALSDEGRTEEGAELHRAAAAFLEEDHDLPVPAPPDGWPGHWSPPRGAGGAAQEVLEEARRDGLRLGTTVALAAHALGEGYAPPGTHTRELGDPDGPQADLRGDALEAWRAALDRAAAQPTAAILDGLAEFLRLAGAPARAAA